MVATTFPPNLADIYNNYKSTGFTSPSRALTGYAGAKAVSAYDRIAIWNDPTHPGHDPLELSGAGVQATDFNSLVSSLGSAKDALANMGIHMDGATDAIPGAAGSLGQANLVRNLATAQMHKNLTDTLGTTLGSDPCGVTQRLNGALTGAADSFLQAADDALATILNLVAQGIVAVVNVLATTIADAVSALDDATGGLLSTIADELGELLQVAGDVLDWAQSSGLVGLYNNPCSKAILDQVAPPGLKSALDTAVSYL